MRILAHPWLPDPERERKDGAVSAVCKQKHKTGNSMGTERPPGAKAANDGSCIAVELLDSSESNAASDKRKK